MNYWTLGLCTYLSVGALFLFIGPSGRLRKVEGKQLRLRNKSAPVWKFLAFDWTLAAIIVLFWPVVGIAAWRHERVEGRAADPNIAVRIAYDALLGGTPSAETIKEIASDLENSQTTYSTFEMAVVIALTYYKQASPYEIRRLAQVQASARVAVLKWAEENQIRALYAFAFEQTLNKMFAPS